MANRRIEDKVNVSHGSTEMIDRMRCQRLSSKLAVFLQRLGHRALVLMLCAVAQVGPAAAQPDGPRTSTLALYPGGLRIIFSGITIHQIRSQNVIVPGIIPATDSDYASISLGYRNYSLSVAFPGFAPTVPSDNFGSRKLGDLHAGDFGISNGADSSLWFDINQSMLNPDTIIVVKYSIMNSTGGDANAQLLDVLKTLDDTGTPTDPGFALLMATLKSCDGPVAWGSFHYTIGQLRALTSNPQHRYDLTKKTYGTTKPCNNRSDYDSHFIFVDDSYYSGRPVS